MVSNNFENKLAKLLYLRNFRNLPLMYLYKYLLKGAGGGGGGGGGGGIPNIYVGWGEGLLWYDLKYLNMIGGGEGGGLF